MSSHRHNWHWSEPCHPLHLLGQCAYHISWVDVSPEAALVQPHGSQQPLIYASGIGVHQLPRTQYGVFANLLSCQQVGQGIGHEEYLVCRLQGGVSVPVHGVQLEEGVKVHELDSRPLIHLVLGYLPEIVVHYALGMWVAVGIRVTQEPSVLAHADYVHSPGIYAYAGDMLSLVGHLLQSAHYFVVQGIDVPIEMSTCLYDTVREPGQFTLHQPTFMDAAQYGASTGGSQVYGKEVCLFHLFCVFCHIIELRLCNIVSKSKQN